MGNTHTHTHTHTDMHTHTHTHTHRHTHSRNFKDTCSRKHTYVHTIVSLLLCVCVSLCVCVFVYAELICLRDGAVIGRSPLEMFGPTGEIFEEEVRVCVCVCVCVCVDGSMLAPISRFFCWSRASTYVLVQYATIALAVDPVCVHSQADLLSS